jgi:hypothetical protein
MHKISVLFLLIIFTLTVFAVPASMRKRPTEAQLMTAKIKYELEAGDVLDLLRKCNANILKGRKDGKPIKIIEYSLYSSRIDDWLKYRWFIADTGLSRKWLKSVQGLILYMRKTQDYIETAKYNRDTKKPKFQQAVKYLDVAYGRFVKLIKKPVRVSAKSVRKAKVKKVMWQKAMRKKYKIKGKIKEEF